VGDQLAVTLTVELPPGQPLTLNFATGQEYDVVVRDSEGRTISQWSRGKMFTQNVHTVTVDGRWSVTGNSPLPPAGAYTVEGWLTTTGGVSPFAATVPVTIPAAAK
jgi:hypothetical protein